MKKEERLPKKQAEEPIAIVGVACRFPGAPDPGAYWKLLAEGKEAIQEITNERWNHQDYYTPEIGAPGKTSQKHSAFLEHIQEFDPFFFNISPREAAEMNPAQMLALELAWEAMEDSSIPYTRLEGSNTGVYLGTCWYDNERLRIEKNSPITQHTALGQATNLIANRISYTFGFRGPSFVLDTGCSASLFATHLACQDLRNGSTDLAMAGGVNILQDPSMYVVMSHFGALSPDGKCYSFDARGNGYVRGEGAGMLLLKRLSDAERSGDKIYAVIRGSALNNNGYNQNLPATSIQGQVEVLEKAYQAAGVDPAGVHYVEAHGTGTRVGDPTETKALGAVLGKARMPERPLHIGSVKTNIGHLEGAAGIAGLIKVVLAMQHKKLPKNLNFEHPNPEIPFQALNLQVQQQLEDWPLAYDTEPMLAGVNAFGWGGTNAHVVVQEHQPRQPKTSNQYLADKTAFTLPLAAKSEEALRDLVKAYHHTLVEKVNGSRLSFAELCAASAIKRPHFEYRVAFTAETKQQMLAQLQEFGDNPEELVPVESWPATRKTVFVFPGQGGQWLGMGKTLYAAEPVFKQVIDACEAAFAPYTNWSLLEQLMADEATSRLKEIDVIQPAICAIQIALAKLWQAWGIVPDVVVGHSMGEVAAACVAGAISLEHAALIICTRSQLMKKTSGQGAMAVTELSAEEAGKIAAASAGKLSVAVLNSPKSSVLSGDVAAIKEVVAELEAKGIFARQVKVDVASHSYQMDAITAELGQALQSVRPLKEQIAIYSTVQNKQMDGTSLDAAYWVSNLRGTVQFAPVVAQLLDSEAYTFVEISPHPVLSAALKECKAAFAKEALIVHATHREEAEYSSMLQNLATLYQAGYPVNWQTFYGGIPSPHYHLPAHPLYREKFVLEAGEKNRAAVATENLSNAVPPAAPASWLEAGLQLADDPHTTYYQVSVDALVFAGLIHLGAQGRGLLSPATLLHMLQLALQAERIGDFQLKDFRLTAEVQLLTTVHLQLKLQRHDAGLKISFYSKAEGAGWKPLAAGEVITGFIAPQSKVTLGSLFTTQLATAQPITGTKFYERLSSEGLDIPKRGQQVLELRVFPERLLARIKSPVAEQANELRFTLPAVLLDACFQVVVAAGLFADKGVLLNFNHLRNCNAYHAADGNLDCWLLVEFTRLGQQREASVLLIQDNGVALWSFDVPLQQRSVDMPAPSTIPQPKTLVQEVVPVSAVRPLFAKMPEGDVEKVLKEAVASIIKTTPARIRMNQSFKKLGIDSLMAVQLKNRLNQALGLQLMVTSLWSVASLAEYVHFLQEQLGTVQHAQQPARPSEKAPASPISPGTGVAAEVSPAPMASAVGAVRTAGQWQGEQLEALLKNEVAAIIKSSPARVKLNQSFKKLGIDSMMAVQLKNRINAALNLSLSVTSFWAYPSMREFLAFLQQQLASEAGTMLPVASTPETTCRTSMPLDAASQQTAPSPGVKAGIITEQERLSRLTLEQLTQELDTELQDLFE